ncbi:MAG: SRPBCC family protein [Bacteroidetes bacterium]|nr:SRPBCC family protein [Bacteroidota bacterium]
MKILKIIILFLIVTTGLYLGACFFLPKNYTIEKKLEINSPADLVFEQVQFLENWKNWNPFFKSNYKISSLTGGENGKENSYIRWKNKNGQEGKLKFIKIEPLKKIECVLTIEKPKPITVNGYISFEPLEKNTTVTFHFEGNNQFYLRILNVFIEKKYKKDLEKTLEMLAEASVKEYEILKNEYFGYKIKESVFEERTVGYVRKTIEYEKLNEFFHNNFNKIKIEARNCNFKISGHELSLYYKPDDVNKVYNVAAAVPIQGDSTLGKDYSQIKLEKQKAIFLNYYGGYYNIPTAETALINYTRNKKLSLKKPIIREHLKGPEQEPDSNKWHTVIWFLIN